MFFRKLIFLPLLLFISPVAAEIKTEVFYDSTYLKVGEVLHYKLQIILPSQLKVVSFETNSYKADINLSIKTNYRGNVFSVSGSVQNFEIEDFFFAGFKVKVVADQNKAHSFILGQHLFHVLKPKIDLQKKPLIREAKSPFELPAGFPWIWVILSSVVLGLIFILYILNKRKNSRAMIPGFESKKDAYLVVLERLVKIRERSLETHADLQEFYFLLTETVKIYLTGRTGEHFLEATTGEVRKLISNVSWLDSDLATGIFEKMQDADFVKFAKYRPPLEEADNFFFYIADALAKSEVGYKASLSNLQNEEDSNGV